MFKEGETEDEDPELYLVKTIATGGVLATFRFCKPSKREEHTRDWIHLTVLIPSTFPQADTTADLQSELEKYAKTHRTTLQIPDKFNNAEVIMVVRIEMPTAKADEPVIVGKYTETVHYNG
jgi:hypothetical protein